MTRQTLRRTVVILTTVIAVGLGAGEARAAFMFVRQFGSPGSGDGQFNQPFGVSTDASGNVFVADVGNDRVEEFSPTPVPEPCVVALAATVAALCLAAHARRRLGSRLAG